MPPLAKLYREHTGADAYAVVSGVKSAEEIAALAEAAHGRAEVEEAKKE